MSDVDNMQDVLDSRDVIARIEELEEDRAALVDEAEAAEALVTEDSDVAASDAAHDARAALAKWDDENAEELAILNALESEASSSPDWIHGESLIRESYFTDYIEELIDDCYSLPKEMKAGEWPWRHMKIDFEAAANEAKSDYMEVDFDGVTYLIRA